jgi:hypothetical protein
MRFQRRDQGALARTASVPGQGHLDQPAAGRNIGLVRGQYLSRLPFGKSRAGTGGVSVSGSHDRMNRTCGWLASAMIVVARSCPAEAAGDGWYIGGQAGASFLEDAENSGSGSDITSTTKNGYSVSGAAGYRFGSGLRADAEFGYRRQGFDRLQIRVDGGLGAAFGVGSLNGATVNATGHVSALSLLANLRYDLDL